MERPASHIYDPDTEDLANAGLQPVAICVECNRFSLSEPIICKGVRIPEHKGWRYQIVRTQIRCITENTRRDTDKIEQCLYNGKYSRMTPVKAKKKEVEASVTGLTPDNSYRPCGRFIWLEKHPRAPAWWVDQMTAVDRKKGNVRCPGVRCLQKGTPNTKGGRKPKNGNKLCTNGGLCRECCDLYQRGGFLPDCGYAPHNYTKKLEDVSAREEQQQHVLTAARSPQLHLRQPLQIHNVSLGLPD